MKIKSFRPVKAEINLSALKNNISNVRRLLDKNTLFMAVVKADGYGHGAFKVSETALEAGADRLGVALAEEALALREKGIAAPIQLLAEPPVEAAAELVIHDIIPAVYTTEFIRALQKEAAKRNMTIKVHLKVDTGMKRAGIDIPSLPGLARVLKDSKNLELEGIMTHFASADEPDNGFTQIQLQAFLSSITELASTGFSAPVKHAANSAACFNFPESRLDMVRIGIAMYGLTPGSRVRLPFALEPVLTLKASVAFVRELKAGEGVSYGLRFKAPKDMKIALLPLGYGDGYTRLFSGKSEVLLKGKRCPVLGTICMDQMLIGLPEGEDCSPGEEVVLIGRQGEDEVSATELAALTGTINYEIACMVSKRVPRVFVNG